MESKKYIIGAVDHYHEGKLTETNYMPDMELKEMKWQLSLDEVADLMKKHNYEFTNYDKQHLKPFSFNQKGAAFLIRGLKDSELEEIAKKASK